ncbi:hypothetical protein O9K51_10066 [Purpureocillium lavendulum]|uniref:Uncharacterized protein n=1 Tax=Purpureocillium lavendulum TaxID=1247861 RepID=A0AB34FG82_9HYPO|nr:hypothetical protein O9K51_10066 [Purpureocillium lavendulum]
MANRWRTLSDAFGCGFLLLLPANLYEEGGRLLDKTKDESIVATIAEKYPTLRKDLSDLSDMFATFCMFGCLPDNKLYIETLDRNKIPADGLTELRKLLRYHKESPGKVTDLRLPADGYAQCEIVGIDCTVNPALLKANPANHVDDVLEDDSLDGDYILRISIYLTSEDISKVSFGSRATVYPGPLDLTHVLADEVAERRPKSSTIISVSADEDLREDISKLMKNYSYRNVDVIHTDYQPSASIHLYAPGHVNKNTGALQLIMFQVIPFKVDESIDDLEGVNISEEARRDLTEEYANERKPDDGDAATNSQEILLFLKHTKDFWYFVFGDDETAMGRLDRATVLALELTAPGACEKDAQVLYGRVRSGEILSAFGEREREAIWTRLCSATVDCLVPSLFGLFENLKYLRVAADCMKRLVHLESKETIRSGFESAFFDTDEAHQSCLIQTSRSSFKSTPARGWDKFDIAYKQLWLFALREYPDMPAEPKKKLAGPKGGHVDEAILFEFATLANRLGFGSKKIQDLLQRDPDRDIARRLLVTARKPEAYRYDDLEACVAEVAEVISWAQPIPDERVMEEDEDMRRNVDALRRRALELETRLEALGLREIEQQARLEQMANAAAEQERKASAAQRQEQDLRETIDALQEAQREEVIRLDKLKGEAAEGRKEAHMMEGGQNDLGDEIRLDLLATGREVESVQNEGDGEGQNMPAPEGPSQLEREQDRLQELVVEQESAQERIQELMMVQREKQASVDRLVEEEGRLQADIEELRARLRQFMEEQKKTAELHEATKRDHDNTIDKLLAKELEHRQTIDQLSACLKRRQEEVAQTAEDEKEAQWRIERLVELERRHEGAIEELAAKHAEMESRGGQQLVNSEAHQPTSPQPEPRPEAVSDDVLAERTLSAGPAATQVQAMSIARLGSGQV